MSASGHSRVPVQIQGAALGLAAAALFGLSTPLAKLLLVDVAPVLLAGLLYLGATTGLWLHRGLSKASREAPLARRDAPTLAAVVLTGGIIGPVLMLLGLRRVTALSGSLLLNLEAPFTVLLATLLFREQLGIQAGVAVAFIIAGAVALKLEPGSLAGDGLGVLLLAAACACWAVDNNLTQRLSTKDPFAIVRVKTLVAGLTNTLLGLTIARSWPSWQLVLGALALGSLSYGASVVLDAFALRLVGAAREAAWFATAPFAGAIASMLVFGDPLRSHDVLAMCLMAAGVVLLLRERHAHEHVHEALSHEHLHHHDAHHQHQHQAGDPPGEPHSHLHHHTPLVHDHPHLPDAHHRHRH
jgi:drug/metabolite transporter (DMT)-like permease